MVFFLSKCDSESLYLCDFPQVLGLKTSFGTTVWTFCKSMTPVKPEFSLSKGILAHMRMEM